jgi:hypothetical protein
MSETLDELWALVQQKKVEKMFVAEGSVMFLTAGLLRCSGRKQKLGSQDNLRKALADDPDGVPVYLSTEVPPLRVAAYGHDGRLLGVFSLPIPLPPPKPKK